MKSGLYRLLSEYPLETLLQTIPTGLFLVDNDKNIVYWNAEATRITGYTAEEAVGRHCSFLHGDPCHIECGLFSEMTPKPEIGLSCSFRHKDGRTIALTKNVDLLHDDSGKVIGGIEAFVDISRLRELEADLRLKVEDRTRELEFEKAGLRAVLDGMTDPTYICDSHYRVSFINRAMAEIIGQAEGELCYKAIYHKDAVCDDCPLPQVLKGKIVQQEKTLPETGRTYEIIHSPYPLAQKPTHKLGVNRDITERIETRRWLQQANRELDAFVSTVSHDLRSPLTPLIGFADLLEERYSDQLDEIGQECIAEIKKTAEKMRDLLEDLLSLSRVSQIKLPDEPIDATRIAESIRFELSDKILETQAQVDIDHLPDVKIPESLLSNLFRNLLGNALKYAAKENSHIEVTGQKFPDRVRFLVIDHGPGIPMSEREAIFEPFHRGVRSRGTQGSGIGLATVAKTARVFSGSCWVEETPGGGATFVVDFPCCGEKT